MSSILNDTKKLLGLAVDYTHFDTDIIIHINSVFDDLNDLGIGPIAGFAITDSAADWSAFLGESLLLNRVKTYMYLRVRLLFDPPATSFAIEAIEKQIEELEWRLNMRREDAEWTAPVTPPPVDPAP